MELALEVGDEYTYRYGKTHKSIGVIESLPDPKLGRSGLITEFPKCVADDLKNIPDVVEAYREYYRRDKAHFCKWTGRETPIWFEFPEL